MRVSLVVMGLTLVLVGNSLPGQEDWSSISSRLKNFEFNYGLADRLQNTDVVDYLQLVDDQKKEIAQIKQKYVKRADKIRDNNLLKPEDRLLKMQELSKPLDEELERVLVPHQKKLLAGIPFYFRVRQEGLVNSMLTGGAIAEHFKLSNEEIRAIKTEAEDLYEEYRQSLINAQKRAIAKLVESYPVEKRDQLKKILEPMLDKNGIFHDNVEPTFKITNRKANDNLPFRQIDERLIDEK